MPSWAAIHLLLRQIPAEKKSHGNTQPAINLCPYGFHCINFHKSQSLTALCEDPAIRRKIHPDRLRCGKQGAEIHLCCISVVPE